MPLHNYSKAFTILLIIAAIATPGQSQDSVTAKVTHVAEKMVRYKINGMKFISFDCRCDSLKRGDVFKIPKSRFDSLLTEAKAVRKRDIEN